MTTEASNPETSPEPMLPTDLGGVATSIQDSLLDIWANFVAHTPFLAGGILVLLATWIVARLIDKLGHRLFRNSGLRESLQDLILRLIIIAAWTLGFLLAAMVVFPGLTPAKALGGLGLLSVAVGLAFKDIFENFFAGILLLWRYPFEKGDFIECQGLTGRIENIEVRMTRIRKTSGELVVVPNSFLFKNPVDVLTDRNTRRVTIMVGVAYGEDVEESVKVIEDAVNACSSIDGEQPVQIFPQAFGASSIDIEVTWWTEPRPVDIRASRGEVVTAVKKALDNAGIEIPFPYRTLTFAEPLPVAAQDGVPSTASDN